MGLSAREVQDQQFSTTMRGFDRSEVCEFLGDVARQLSSLEQQLKIANVKADHTQQELDNLGDVLDAKLAEVHEARQVIVDEARREAASIASTSTSLDGGAEIAGTARQAAAILAEAEAKATIRIAEVENVVDTAQLEAARIVKEAEDTASLRIADADRILEDARRQARSIHAETEVRRSDTESQLREILIAAQGWAEDDHSELNIAIRSGNEIVLDLTERSTANQTATF